MNSDMEKAREIAKSLRRDYGSDESLLEGATAAAIVCAIKAEREACALFIETHTTDYCQADRIVPIANPSVSNTALANAIRASGGE